MSFIQCKNESEVEEKLEGKPCAFITEDHRIYDEIMLSDDAVYYTFDGMTAIALYDLQCNLERMSEDLHSEMSFRSVEEFAKELRESYEAALAAIKFKPLERKKRK